MSVLYTKSGLCSSINIQKPQMATQQHKRRGPCTEMTGQRKPSPIPWSVRIIGEERRKQNARVDYGSGDNVNIDGEDNLLSGISPDDNINGDYSPGDGSTAPTGSRTFNSSIEEEKKNDIAKEHQDGKANNKSGNTVINIKNMIGDDDKKHPFEARRILHPDHDDKPQVRDRIKPSTRSSYSDRDGGQSVIPQLRVDLAKLSTESLSRYCQHFNIVGTNSSSSRQQMLDAAQQHFVTQPPLDEEQVITEFILAAKRLKQTD